MVLRLANSGYNNFGMELLTAAKIIFYFTSSFVVLVIGILLAVLLYYFLMTAKKIKKISENLSSASSEVKEWAERLIALISGVLAKNWFSGVAGRKRNARKKRRTV